MTVRKLKITKNQILTDLKTNNVLVAKVPRTDYSVTELFAGAGGMALGFEKAGLQHKLLIEHDKWCCQTLLRNRPDWRIYQCDVAEFDFTGVHTDVVSGGFPCQDYSHAGGKQGFATPRGSLMLQFIRAVEEIHPKVCVAENVSGLVRHSRAVGVLQRSLERLGYNVQMQVLNALNYDVAQKRKRVFIVGTLPSVQFEYPLQTGRSYVLRDVIDDPRIRQGNGATYSPARRAVYRQVPPGGCWRDLPPSVAEEFMGTDYYKGGGRTGYCRRLSMNEPCLTLLTSPAQRRTERIHPMITRPLNILEYARIQTFPDLWGFKGSLNSRYRQIGNAVPVNLAFHIGLSVIDALRGYTGAVRGDPEGGRVTERMV